MSDPPQDVKLPPEATVVVFEPTIAPLRVPLPANQDDEPSSKGPFILAFKDEDAWLRAWQDCEVKVARECEAGARIGCSISATKECKSPWWHMAFPFFKKLGGRNEDREACEEAHMERCVADAEEKCSVYAKDICKESFGNARIVKSDSSSSEHGYRCVKRSSWREAL